MKLPELRSSSKFIVFGERIQEHDFSNKLQGKLNSDHQRRAEPSHVVPGDTVLMKNTKSSGKLDSNFESKPYTVVTKEGAQVTVK